MGKFKVGDRVRFTDDAIGIKLTGKTGTVIPDKDSVILPGEGATVRLDKPVEDFFEGGKRDWIWVFDRKLELVKPEKQPVVVITSDGKTTTATKRLGKKVICTAAARCSDDDTFDFNTGAELAFKRLREKEKPVPKETPWPKKLVCVEANVYPEDFCIGRTYNVEHWGEDFGLLRLKNGSSWGIRRHSDTDFRINMFPDYARFIPLVED